MSHIPKIFFTNLANRVDTPPFTICNDAAGDVKYTLCSCLNHQGHTLLIKDALRIILGQPIALSHLPERATLRLVSR